MKKIFATTIFLLALTLGFSQSYWNTISKENIHHLESQINAKNAIFAELDVDIMGQILAYATLFDVANPYQHTQVQIEIPLPNGKFETFKVFNAPVMEPELAEKFPEINTYMVVAVSGHNYGRIDLTPKGFHAMIFSLEGTVFIDPYTATSNDFYISYYKKDFYTNKELSVCLHDELDLEHDHQDTDEELSLEPENFTPKLTYGSELRRYRAAISATGEYTQFHGGTVSLALAAIVTSLNRISGVYERDFSITFQLVANNDLIIFTNPNTDPFTSTGNNIAGQLIQENPTVIGNAIGSANYDIGHVFATVGSGLASQGVCGNNNNKARGVTGIANPIGDPYDIDYVAHEIGHQFSASHTFNSTASSCGGNRSAANAYEPGSGSTIMAYANICAPENLQTASDDYFHTRSFIQIFNYSNSQQANTCPVKTNTNNSLPNVTSITASSTFTIPKETPFEMRATATDADGDLLTYCWEQYDQQTASTVITAPTGNQPLFRSFNPVTTGNRVFPKWSDILNNTTTIGERLPTYGRNMSFRLMVRDNRPGAGGIFIANSADNEPPSIVRLTVTNNAGPFLVTNPNTAAVVWSEGFTETVTWNVAGTTANGVNCNAVDIFLSTDGGQNFNIQLAQGVPNNGSASITVPTVNTSQARVMVKCANNIFFDVSNFNFTIQFDCSSVISTITINSSTENSIACAGQSFTFNVDATTPTLGLSYQWYFNNTAINGATSASYTIVDILPNSAGNYYCEVSNACAQEQTDNIVLQVNTVPPIPQLLLNGNQLVSTYSGTVIWYLNGAEIPGANNFIFNPTEEGTYTVSSVENGCVSAPSNQLFFQFTYINGLQVQNNLNVLLYPNPTKDNFTIVLENWNKDTQVKVFNILGKLVLAESTSNGFLEINASNLSKGTYIVKIDSENLSTVKKVVVE